MFGNNISKTRSMADKLVEQRRTEEKILNNLNKYIKDDKIARHISKFELENDKLKYKDKVSKDLTNYKQQKEQILLVKRNRLRDLLIKEEDMYIAELRGLRPNPEKIKEIMRTRVAELKIRNEEDRLNFVERKREQQFKENTDELRHVDVKINEYKTRYERDIQMIEKQKELERQYKEEMLYAKLNQKDYELKQLKEKEELKQKLLKIKERNQVIEDQLKDLKHKKIIELEREKEEKIKLKEKFKNDDLLAKLKEEERRKALVKLNEGMKQHNIEQKAIREQHKREELENDKFLIQKQIEKEEMLFKLEKEQKEKYKKETKEYLLNFKNRSNELKLNQNLIDKLLAEESELQWQKQLKVWRENEEKRTKLMLEVYKNMEQKVYENIDKKRFEKDQKMKELEKINEEYKKYLEEEKHCELVNKLSLKNYQYDIINQINIKINRKRKELFEEFEYQRNLELESLRQKQKIREVEEKGLVMLKELNDFKNSY